MSAPTNYLDIIKFLPGDNCRNCDRSTCMVFAVEVAQGKQEILGCPRVEPETVKGLRIKTPPPPKMAESSKYLDILKFLPGDNCQQCGRPSCRIFAVEVAQGKQEISGCPYVASGDEKD